MELNLDSLDLKYIRLSVRQPAAERRLLASLGESGQQSPVIVVSGAEPGRYVVVDGSKRVCALRKLRADVVKTSVWEMSESEALATAYQLSAQGKRGAFEEGWLVAELHRGFGWSLGAAGERLVRSKSWVSRRLALVEELPEWMADEVASGRLGAHAAANYLVPLTRGNREDGRRLAEGIRGLGLSDRQIGELCACCRGAGASVRRRIVESPGLYLKAREAAKVGRQEAALDERQQRCVKNLELIGNVSLGLARGLPEALGYDALPPARRRLRVAWSACSERFGMLAEQAAGLMAEEGDDAGQADAGGDTDAGGAGPQGARDISCG